MGGPSDNFLYFSYFSGSQYIEPSDVEKAFECFVAGKIEKIEDNQV